MDNTDRILNEIVPYLPLLSQRILLSLSQEEQADVREIRIKVGCPLLLYSGSGRRIFPEAVHTKDELESTFRKVCGSSAYTHRNEIRAGFVTLPGGHRVGIMGSAVMSDSGRVEGMRDIYGLTFRIAREFSVPMGDLLTRIRERDRMKNLLIIGPPCSGKTTVLRALAKAMSEQIQVSVIDEREELFPITRPVPVGCDVLRGYPKAVGILQALRTLSPGVIVCDEIGSAEEVRAMADGLRSGVSLVVSAHAFDPAELVQRPPVRDLIRLGGIDLAAFLDPERVGTVKYIKEREDLCVEINHASVCVSPVCGDRSGVCS